ncbi:beta-ketoacyl synthase N-terminal-like domain-containing protein [Photorhabdus laumondii]
MDIAITGFSFRLPGAGNILELEALLESGQDALTFPSYTPNDRDGWVSRAGYLTDADQFDYELFGISLRDSYVIEPQQRMFIQCAWRALEQAGYNPKRCEQTVGVYSSSSDSHYPSYLADSELALDKYDPFEIEIGANKEQQSLRCAYLFDLKGPAVGIQSACSSGLLSIHMAMQGIASGDCDMAIAGGACLPYPLHSGYQYQPGMNLSQSGVLASYSSSADGMVPGFGCVVFVLKALDKARNDKDTIFGVLSASSINNDGRAKSSYMAPSIKGIARNIQNVLAKSALDVHEIDFVEGHGSGTKIGDVLETAALKKAFENSGLEINRIALSSVKANVGHLDVAAGHAGLLKSVLQVWNSKLYPAANFSTLNPNLNLELSPFYIPTKVHEKNNLTGIVNSLGIGGTNCAMVIRSEEFRLSVLPTTSEPVEVLVGAENDERLKTLLRQLQAEIKRDHLSLEDVAYTLARRSMGKACMVKFSVESLSELHEQIAASIRLGIASHHWSICLNEYAGKAVLIEASEIDPDSVVKVESHAMMQDNAELEKRDSARSEPAVRHEILRTIWLDNLMLNDVEEEDSFSDLGGHSILALSLVTDINAAFDLTLTLDWVEKFDVFSAQLQELQRITSRTKQFSLVKPLFFPDSAKRATLILIHASISGVEVYKNLSKNISDVTEVIGIDSYNLYNKNKVVSIDKLAAIYADDILGHVTDKTTPIFIGGWSLGGLLARKITALLTGKLPVKGNILLDSVKYSPCSAPLFSDENLSYFMVLDHFSNTLSCDDRARENLKTIFEIERRMVKDFQDPEINLPILNVVATRSLTKIENDKVSATFESLKRNHNNWQVNELMTVRNIHTDHVGLVADSNINEVSNCIRGFLYQYV